MISKYTLTKRLNNYQLIRFYCKDIKNKYTNTVLVPKTKFSQKLTGKKLIGQNKYVLENCGFKDIYSWQNNLEKPEFILHDGPPYANGKPHMGHMINKILKDIINRFQIVKGKKVNYVPGWDCHGLPIELKALNKVKKENITALDIRNIATTFAKKTIEEQKKVFQSWGVFGDWDRSYETYTVPYIKNQLKQFYKLYEKNLVYRDYKPVYWSPSSRTALAEAELQYNENHKSISVILKLKLSRVPEVLKSYTNEVHALIWTTTPWTLPSNQAVCYNPTLNYSLVQNKNNFEMYIIASELVDEVSKSIKSDLTTVLSFLGKQLVDTKYYHPFQSNEELPFLPGTHATASKGTGLVHTAPAHGPEDFLLALAHKIPVKCIVDESGQYTHEGNLKGLSVLKEGNEKVLDILKTSILSQEEYVHSYPYDWRTNKPIILRASQQWFIDTNSIKERALELIENVKIVPEKNSEIYKQNLINQVKKRPYWCISRQRVWGVPIPVFYNDETPFVTQNSITHLCGLLEKHGPDFWWKLPISELLSTDLKAQDLRKGGDIFDIWFDSGVSWSYVLGDQIADMYLEGYDQFNGWFQSSLITSVALRDKIPYKMLYVHGFAVDQNGFKMSKSLGNVIDPQELMEGGKKHPMGIDPLRWWVASHASQGSTAYVSQNILQNSQDEIQKIRNTLRFAVAALDGFEKSNVDLNSLKIIDRYLLHLTYEFDKQVSALFEEYQFNKLCITVVNFITNTVSALYYSIIKDRLYCNSVNDTERKSAQFVLSVLLDTISKSIAPIVPHLIEELYMYRTDQEYTTFFKNEMIKLNQQWNQPDIVECVEQALNVKKYINKQYSNTSELKCELICSTDIYKKLKVFQKEDESELEEILQVSEFYLKENSEMSPGSYNMNLTKSNYYLCERCRKYNSKIDGELCFRCNDVINILNKVKSVV